MTPEEEARKVIDEKLKRSGWVIQNMNELNLCVALGVAVREFPTSTGEVDYSLFVDGMPVGVVEAKKSEEGQNITVVEEQTSRYANSTFKWIKGSYRILLLMKRLTKLLGLQITMILNTVQESFFPFTAPKR